MAAVRPLRVVELAEVLAVDFNGEGTSILNLGWWWEDHKEAVMSTCSSLVIIVDHKDKVVGGYKYVVAEKGNKAKNKDS